MQGFRHKKLTARQQHAAHREYDHLFKIKLVGDLDVGTSELLLRFAGDDTCAASYVSTIGVDFKIGTVESRSKTCKLQIWDNDIHLRLRTLSRSSYLGHGIIFVYSITDEESFFNVQGWIEEIKRLGYEGFHMMLIGNNSEQANRRIVDTQMGQKLAQCYGMCFIETSSANNVNVQSALQMMADGIMDTIDGGECSRCNHELTATRLERNFKRNQLRRHRLYRVNSPGCCAAAFLDEVVPGIDW